MMAQRSTANGIPMVRTTKTLEATSHSMMARPLSRRVANVVGRAWEAAAVESAATLLSTGENGMLAVADARTLAIAVRNSARRRWKRVAPVEEETR